MASLFRSRIKALREERGLLQQDMADLLGISKSAYGFYEQGKREPDFDTLSALADFFKVSVDFLLGRRESPSDAGPAYVPVPILGCIQAGPDGFLQEDFRGNLMTEKRLVSSAPSFWLEVRGDSMTGLSINEGDHVLVSREPCTESGKICAVMIEGTEATLKRVRFCDDGMMLEAANPAYPARFFSSQQLEDGTVRIIGVAKQIRRVIS